mgnify:CR=1 FL=1
MIFERAVRREFAQAAAGISVALLAILASILLIRLLKEAVGGRIQAEAVASLLGFAILNLMSLMLTLMLFVAILLSLSRAYRDSEMVVWFSSGLPLTAWIRPVLVFALPFVAVIALLSNVLSPWANLSTAQYRQVMAARNDLSHLSPGVFQETKKGQRVFFVEASDNADAQLGSVFVASVQDGRLGVVVSDRGYQEYAENGDRFAVLERGRRYEVEPGSPEFRVMEFERYKLRTEDAETKPADRLPNRLNLMELIADGSDRARGELLWRIGVPVSALILSLLAIPLSYVNPRAGRSANMLIAILIYAIYSNLLWVAQAWVSQGKIPFWIGVWMVHALMLLPLAALFYRRLNLGRRWRRLGSA